MKPAWWSILILSTVGLPGCYDFDSPIDPAPKLALDQALLGTWRCLPFDAEPDSEAATFVVGTSAERVYSISFPQPDKEPERYEAYASRVKGHRLLNVHNPNPKFPSKPWTFVRYSLLTPNVLRTELVNDAPLKAVEQSPAALRRALERLDKDPSLYEDYCVCVRAVAKPKSDVKQ